MRAKERIMDIAKMQSLTKEERLDKARAKRYISFLWNQWFANFNYIVWRNPDQYDASTENTRMARLYRWNKKLEVGADITWPEPPLPQPLSPDLEGIDLGTVLEYLEPKYKDGRKGMCADCVHQWPMKHTDHRGEFVWKFCTKHSMYCKAIVRNCKGPEGDVSERKPLPEMSQAACRNTYTDNPELDFFERVVYRGVSGDRLLETITIGLERTPW